MSDIKLIKLEVYRPNSSIIVATGYLKDDGKNGDTTPNDGIYSSNFSFRTIRQSIGMFDIGVQAEDKSGLLSNKLFQKMNVYTQLKPPIIYNLNAPDTIALPTSGFKIIQMSIAVYDSNGMNDIYEVFFRSLDSSDPAKKYFMYDSGDIKNHGDSLANDGIYSIKIELPYNTTQKPYRFEFAARDLSGLLSNKITHTLNVIRP